MKLSLILIMGGILLLMAAVGGMESVPVWEENPYWREQMWAALAGLVSLFLGVMMLPREPE